MCFGSGHQYRQCEIKKAKKILKPVVTLKISRFLSILYVIELKFFFFKFLCPLSFFTTALAEPVIYTK